MSRGRRITEEERQEMFDIIKRGIEFRCKEKFDLIECLRWGDKFNFRVDFNVDVDTALLFYEEKPNK